MPRRVQPRFLWCATALVAALAVLLPATARADYEQVPETFGTSGEGQQLRGATAIAVNESGNGGVEAGSFYVVGVNRRVLRFSPGEEGTEPAFQEAWGWGIAEGGGGNEFSRCGPAVAGHPACKPVKGGSGGEQTGNFSGLAGVAVDQTTGYVYVRNTTNNFGPREKHLIEVFTATGTPIGAGFGESGDGYSTPRESIAEGPEKLHNNGQPLANAIVVDAAGTVYLNDADFNGIDGPAEKRVMSFEPCTPGDYGSYCYTGRADDLVTPQEATRLALVGSDRLVTMTGTGPIREYALGSGAGASNPICSFAATGQPKAMTADPVTGEVFYYLGTSNRKVFRLGPCDESTGTFEELQALKPAPESANVLALAVNAGRAWSADRPAGILYAVNAGENLDPIPPGIGYVFAPAEILNPEVLSESVSDTATGSSTLRARVDPRGFATSYYFQYLDAAAYAARKAAAEGEGKDAQEAEDAAFASAVVAPARAGEVRAGAIGTATASVSGLQPDTEYAFRVVVASGCNGAGGPQCVANGEAAFFRTYAMPPAGLPDGRAYELVSPAQKNGGEVFPAQPNVGTCGQECKPPGGASLGVFPMQSSPGGDAVAYMGYPFFLNEGSAGSDAYISRRGPSGWRTTVVSPRLRATIGGEDLTFDDQLTRGAIYQWNPQLAPSAPAGYANVYLQDTANPEALQPLLTAAPPNRVPRTFGLRYAGHSPDFAAQFFSANDALTGATPYAPAPPDPGYAGSDLYEWRGGRLALINVLPGNAAVATDASLASASPDSHAVSADGRRVFWQAGLSVYVREDGQITRLVRHSGTFLTASSSGLRMLFADGCLYSLLTEECVDLTQGQGGFQGIAGQSEDLSRVYFVDTAVLPGSGTNDHGQEAQAGEYNLYSWSEGGVAFVATLIANDNQRAGGGGTWKVSPGARNAEASPDGRFLAFMSQAQPTGFDNLGACPEVGNTHVPLCGEVYLYDSANGRLTCPSCNPTGEAPLGEATLRTIRAAPAWLPQPRYLTNAGRLFFDTGDRLSPRDTNGGVEDVYELEPYGVGSCARRDGCITLISPGTGSLDSNFLAMDQSGANVFFTSRERLVPADTDELIDLYDAREGGGFPGEGEATSSQCRGEACQSPANPPSVPLSGTSTFQGTGNVKPAQGRRCSRGKVKRKGKCVAKKRFRKHGKHASKKHKGKKHKGKRSRAARHDRPVGHDHGGTK